MSEKDQIKELLHPHYGHLNFLLKIKNDTVSMENIKELLTLIKDKSLICHLPKQIQQYNSYYTLMKDLYITNENRKLLSKIKNSTASHVKIILVELLSDVLYKQKLTKIFNDEELVTTFKRWSSRIKTKDYAKVYIDSVLNNKDILEKLNGDSSKLVDLTDYKSQKHLLPSSWCLTDYNQFENYTQGRNIYLFPYNGSIYGVNVPKSRYGSITIQNSNNQSVRRVRESEHIYKAAENELLKLKLFGQDKKAEKKIRFNKKFRFVDRFLRWLEIRD